MSARPARPQGRRRRWLGRSRTGARSARWFWEIDKVLLVLVAVLIAIGLIAVAAASPAAAQRYSGGGDQRRRRFIISTASWSGSRSPCR